MDRKLRPRATSRALPLARASRWLRLRPPLHAARLQVRPTRPTLEPRNLLAQPRHQSLQLDQLLPLLDNQALQFGRRQVVKIVGRRHAHNASDSRRLENLIIIPMPRLLPLLGAGPRWSVSSVAPILDQDLTSSGPLRNR